MNGRYVKYSHEDGTIFYEQKQRMINNIKESHFRSPFFIRREKSGFIVSSDDDGIAAWVVINHRTKFYVLKTNQEESEKCIKLGKIEGKDARLWCVEY